jgi:hypothetical protein
MEKVRYSCFSSFQTLKLNFETKPKSESNFYFKLSKFFKNTIYMYYTLVFSNYLLDFIVIWISTMIFSVNDCVLFYSRVELLVILKLLSLNNV